MLHVIQAIKMTQRLVFFNELYCLTNLACCFIKYTVKMIITASFNSHLGFRILNDAVFNFPNNQEEITLVVCPETVKVKNYVDDEPGTAAIIDKIARTS